MSRGLICVVMALTVAGCGGSGGNVQSTPTPVPMLPKTPISQGLAPPELSPVTSGTLSDALKGDADFRTGSTEVIYDAGAKTLSSRNKAYGSPNSIRVYFDAASGNYIISNIPGTAHRFPDGYRTASGPPFTAYGENGTDGGRRLSILTPSDANSTLALTYTSFGVWQFDSSNRSNIDPQINDYHFFYFGIPTPADGMPRTGSANYNGLAQGVLFDPHAIYLLNGTMTLGADFAANSIDTTLTLSASNTTNSLAVTLPVFNGTAAIGAGRNYFVGTLATPDNSFVGSVQGAFFGPTAQEVGYSFGINSPDRTRIGGGVAVGKR